MGGPDCSVGGADPGHVVLSGLRKQTKQVKVNKLITGIPPWFLFQFLPQFPLMMDYEL